MRCLEIQQTFGLSDIVSNFSTTGAFQKYEELGTGNVNDTYLIFAILRGRSTGTVCSASTTMFSPTLRV